LLIGNVTDAATINHSLGIKRVHLSMALKPDDASITDDGVVKHLTAKEGSVIQAVTPAVLYLSC
jgi:hypothetical protein